MNKELFTQEKIRAYLLGSLPDAEAERFDDLSVTDDEFSDALTATENDLVDDYVRGELTGKNLEKFKLYYLASALRREKVEFAESLQIYTARKFSETENNSVSGLKTSGGLFAAIVGFINSKPLQVGFAAGLVLLVLSGLWFVNNRGGNATEVVIQSSPAPKTNESPQNQINSSKETEVAAVVNENVSPQNKQKNTANKNTSIETNRNSQPEKTPVTPPKIAVASFILTPGLRGNNQLKIFPISKEITDVAVSLQLESDDYTTYRVALTDESGGKNLWQNSALKVRGTGENKTLNIRFPAKLLKSQVYSLTVSGTKNGETEIITNYSFRSVLK